MECQRCEAAHARIIGASPSPSRTVGPDLCHLGPSVTPSPAALPSAGSSSVASFFSNPALRGATHAHQTAALIDMPDPGRSTLSMFNVQPASPRWRVKRRPCPRRQSPHQMQCRRARSGHQPVSCPLRLWLQSSASRPRRPLPWDVPWAHPQAPWPWSWWTSSWAAERSRLALVPLLPVGEGPR